MRKITIIILIFVNYIALSQGFDWQYSYRLPYRIPEKFIGIKADYSLISSTGHFEFMEDYIPCCNYTSGNGYSAGVGLVYENWLNPMNAISVNFHYSSINTFFNQSIQVPRSDGITDYIATYKYEMEEKRRTLNLISIFKHRLFSSHWSAFVGLNFSYLLSSDATHTEAIISPEGETYIDQSRKRTIKKGMYGDYNKLGINPIIGINYDYVIYKDYYAAISGFVQTPFSNIIRNQNWKEWKFQFSVSIFKAID